MTAYNVINPSSMQAGQPEDISVVLSNLNAIAAVINGGLDNSNLSAAAAIVASKLAGYPSDGTKFLKGDGTWAAPAAPPAGLALSDITLANASRASDLALATSLQQVLTTGAVTTPACNVTVEFFLPGYVSAHTAQAITVYVQVDGNGDAMQLPLYANFSPNSYPPVFFRRRAVLGAGAHTFDVQAVTTATVATLRGGGGSGTLGPMLLTVTRVA